MMLSIIAYDDGDDLLGAAVTSCVLAAGRRVLHVRPGIGAAVVQAHSEITWGDDILDRLAAGMSPDAAIAPHRGAGVQIAAIRRGGTLAAYTGRGCERHAGHATGDSVSAQVNMAQLSDACQRMVGAFETNQAPLAERLVAALAASGGDARGRQSAAVIVTGPGELRGNADEPHVDLRVGSMITAIPWRSLLDCSPSTGRTVGCASSLRVRRR